jgi:hypothetical protein
MHVLIMIRDALIAIALAWVGVTLETRQAEAPVCEASRCQESR